MVRRSVVLAAGIAIAAAPAKSPIEGVCKVFTHGHDSVRAINADRPRTVVPCRTAPATDKDKVARYDHWTDVTGNSRHRHG